jgi:hypothetical protein
MAPSEFTIFQKITIKLCSFSKTERINDSGIFIYDKPTFFLEVPESLKFSCGKMTDSLISV